MVLVSNVMPPANPQLHTLPTHPPTFFSLRSLSRLRSLSLSFSRSFSFSSFLAFFAAFSPPPCPAGASLRFFSPPLWCVVCGRLG